MKTDCKHFLYLIFILLSKISSAQSVDVLFLEKDKMLLHIAKSLNSGEVKSMCSTYALPLFSIDSLFEYNHLGELLADGWKIKSKNNDLIVLERPLNKIENTSEWSKSAILIALENLKQVNNTGTWGYPMDVSYGKNKFSSKVTVRQLFDGKTQFWLPGHQSAKKVFLSGNFNDWSPYTTSMAQTDSGWVCSVILDPGKYFYKFIVDGTWTEDKFNKLHEADGHGGNNSTYFQTNYTFKLKDHKSAKRVILSGSFNNWDTKELTMSPSADGWFINIFLQDGVHTYKFIVDGEWIIDPSNKRVRPDGEGNFNSVIGKGDTITFFLKNYADAHQVILSGNFNQWRTAELQMEKTPSGWKYDYMLPPGNYEYKFIVDGKWIIDPDNPYRQGEEEIQNSFLVVKPNHTFSFKNTSKIKQVSVSGTFNSWNEPGFKMYYSQVENKWTFPIYLKPGKHLYKLFVDGKWIIDPENSNWEENEHGTGNSVLWIDNKKK